MRTLQLAFLLVCIPFRSDLNAEQIIRKMYGRYHGKWYQHMTFIQTTESYKNDSLTNKTTWYEAVSFPDKFRIDFGDLKNGDAVIFRNDSVYDFRKGQLKNSGLDKNDLTFLLGGLYFYPMDKVLESLKALHYDLGKFHEDKWQGRVVYVIGANTNDEKLNQLWIDKEKLILVRFLKYDDHRKEEGLFENHIALEGGWTETRAIFFVNDKLIQKEFYRDCKTYPKLDPGIFEPAQFGKIHWFKP